MTLEYEREYPRRIVQSGGSAAAYIPKEFRVYVDIGDNVKVITRILDNNAEIVIRKNLRNFDLGDVRGLVLDRNFKIVYDKATDDFLVFEAKRDSLSISYTRDTATRNAIGHVTLTRMWDRVNHQSYRRVKELEEKLAKEFNAIVRVEGDLDVVKILKESEVYKIDETSAFRKFNELKKNVGLSITIRLNDRRNELRQVDAAIRKLEELDA
ncbi:MAG: hypothetical protein JRN21_00645 [Nitrososphaerota archaeon]|nr:hypothetical protein [Nitrososphaerota archaeon]